MSGSPVLQREVCVLLRVRCQAEPTSRGEPPNFWGIKEFVPSDITPSMGGPWDIWFWNDPKLGFKMGILFFPVSVVDTKCYL